MENEIITIEQEHLDLKDAFRDAMEEAFNKLEDDEGNYSQTYASVKLIDQTYTSYSFIAEPKAYWKLKFELIKKEI